jgi:DNA-directed RNA polymerase specialized sigma24 family protein
MHRLGRLVGRDQDRVDRAVRAAWQTCFEERDGRPDGASLRGWLLFLVLRELAAPAAPADPPPAAAVHELEPVGTRWAGWWKDGLSATPEPEQLALEYAITSIPAGLAAVFVLRDVEGLDAAEVTVLLAYDAELQLDLLQNARSSIRNALRDLSKASA